MKMTETPAFLIVCTLHLVLFLAGGSAVSQSHAYIHTYSSSSVRDSRSLAAFRTPSLRLLGVEVPVFKFRGEDAELVCKYDRGSDPLYSVQWYKDDMEFFRFMFRNKPPKKSFVVPGITVDVNRSNERRILLHNLTFNSTGTYRCEVSADAPHFRTYTNESRMVVVEFPKSRPIITGAKSHYRVGETAWLNCTSSKSHPAAQLTWFINGEKVNERNLRYYHKWVHKDGLESSRLGLVFTVRASHFLKGDLALKCQATVSTIYSGTNEQDAQIVNEPIILEQKENRIFVRSSSSGLVCPPSSYFASFLLLLPAFVNLRVHFS